MRVLRQRGLSIHAVIGYDGRILRCADPETTVCYHAGSKANERFLGVEIVNKALGAPTKAHPRDLVAGRAHGRALTVLDFSEAQYASVLALADEWSSRYGIPRITAHGTDAIDVRKASGHVEHIHVSKRKIDCAGLIMERLRSSGYA